MCSVKNYPRIDKPTQERTVLNFTLNLIE